MTSDRPGPAVRNVVVPLRFPINGVVVRHVSLLEGPVGWGEWSPLPGYDCPAHAAWRSAHEAAYEQWPDPVRSVVAVNALIPGADPPTAAAQAKAAADAGYACLKLKVGHGDDLSRLAAVREAVGPSVALRVDANGVWDVETAISVLGRLARYDLELVEQPVAAIEDLAVVRRKVAMPVAADECLRTLDDALAVAALDAADVVVLKVQPLGGVRPALRMAEAAGRPVIVTSMMETSVGVAAGLALAAALDELPYPCGLGTVSLLAADVVAEPLVAERGTLRVRRPVPDPDLLDRYDAAGPAGAADAAAAGSVERGPSLERGPGP